MKIRFVHDTRLASGNRVTVAMSAQDIAREGSASTQQQAAFGQLNASYQPQGVDLEKNPYPKQGYYPPPQAGAQYYAGPAGYPPQYQYYYGPPPPTYRAPGVSPTPSLDKWILGLAIGCMVIRVVNLVVVLYQKDFGLGTVPFMFIGGTLGILSCIFALKPNRPASITLAVLEFISFFVENIIYFMDHLEFPTNSFCFDGILMGIMFSIKAAKLA